MYAPESQQSRSVQLGLVATAVAACVMLYKAGAAAGAETVQHHIMTSAQPAVAVRASNMALQAASGPQLNSRRAVIATAGAAAAGMAVNMPVPAWAEDIYPDFDEHCQMEILKPGDGVTFPTVGKNVEVHYIGRLTDGTVFDSSRKRGQTFKFPIGTGRVIKGWDAAVLRMSVGETARITIYPEWAYGKRGIGPIPPNAVLVFDVELISV